MIPQHRTGCKTENFMFQIATVRFIEHFQEGNKMKTITENRQNKVRYPAYPNAADRQYFLHKLLDGALAVVTTVGAVVALVFLLFI